MDVGAIPGLEHLPWAKAWLHEPDEDRWRAASTAARGLGKSGLEVWTTTKTPAVVDFLAARGYLEVRRYVISELDVAAAADPEPPRIPLVTFAQRPDLAQELYVIACESYVDQPGQREQRMPPFEGWRSWGLDPHAPDAYFIALGADGRAIGYGFLELEGDAATHGFAAVARASRGCGVAGAIKRAQIAWAKAHGLRALRTATEVRLTHMRALNDRHGYRPLYEEIVLRGPLAPDDQPG